MAVWVHDEHSEQHPSPAQGEKKMRPPGRAHEHLSPHPKHADTHIMEPAGPTSIPRPTPLVPIHGWGDASLAGQEQGDTESTSVAAPPTPSGRKVPLGRWQWHPERPHGNTEVRPPLCRDLTPGPLDSGWAIIAPTGNGGAVKELSRKKHESALLGSGL